MEPRERERRLYTLIVRIWDEEELRAELRRLDLHAAVASSGVSLEQLAAEFASALARRGRADAVLFGRLLGADPRERHEIEALAEAWGISAAAVQAVMPCTADVALPPFLTALFDDDRALRTYVRWGPDGERVEAAIPDTVEGVDLAAAATRAWVSHGHLDVVLRDLACRHPEEAEALLALYSAKPRVPSWRSDGMVSAYSGAQAS